MTRRLSPLFSGIAAGLLWACVASADPSAADRATARSLAEEGYWALQEKHYADAVDRFRRADALVHAPTLTLDWARGLVGMGQLVEAQERYELVIREGVDPKAPPSWRRALAAARAEVAALKPRLSWATIAVKGSKEARVTIDGVAVPAAAIGVRRAVNPGAHEVAVSAPGFLGKHQRLSLAEGEEGSITFELEADPDQQQPVPVFVAPTPPAPVEAPRPRSRAPIYVAFGVAGAGFVVGGVTGVLALGKRSTLQKNCPDPNNCGQEDADTVSAYNTLGTVSGVGFIVGIAGVATGITLWLLDNKSSSTPARGLVVRPYLGVGSIGAVGNF
ncbi:MAG: hypothetical protein WDO74_16815 [Pseudomonadota bacterium]